MTTETKAKHTPAHCERFVSKINGETTFDIYDSRGHLIGSAINQVQGDLICSALEAAAGEGDYKK